MPSLRQQYSCFFPVLVTIQSMAVLITTRSGTSCIFPFSPALACLSLDKALLTRTVPDLGFSRLSSPGFAASYVI